MKVISSQDPSFRKISLKIFFYPLDPGVIGARIQTELVPVLDPQPCVADTDPNRFCLDGDPSILYQIPYPDTDPHTHRCALCA